MILFLIFSVSQAFAQSYDRAVSFDWGEIPGAIRYEVEISKGSNCKESTLIETTQKAEWEKEMTPGKYCLRVRGVAEGDREGQWSDFQKITVHPKPPQKIEYHENKLKWDSVSYANSYRVEMKTSDGKVFFQKTVSENEINIPEPVLKKWGMTQLKAEFKVFTQVKDLPDSNSGTVEVNEVHERFLPKKIITARKLKKENKPLVPRKRELPPQPKPHPVEVVQSIERYTFQHEIPLPPVKEEWKKAHTIEEKEDLRTRTIASARVELLEQENFSHPSDLVFELGTFIGPSYYRVRMSDNDGKRTSESRSVRPLVQVSVEYNRKRKVGGYLKYSQMSITNGNRSAEFSNLELGVERNFNLDSVWNSVFTTGLSIQLRQHPTLFENDPSENGGVPNLLLTNIGLGLYLGHRWNWSRSWGIQTRGEVSFAPRQKMLGTLQKNGYRGAQVETGVHWEVTRDIEVSGGASVFASNTTNGDSIESVLLVGYGGFVNAGYRMRTTASRSLAAEIAYQKDSRHRFHLSFDMPLKMRRETLMNFSNGSEPQELTPFIVGADLDFKYQLFTKSPWYFRAGTGWDSLMLVFNARGGYELPLFRRKDLSMYGEFGANYRSFDSNIETGGSVHAQAVEVALLGGVRKMWTDRILSDFEAKIGIPVYQKDDQENSETLGQNYQWSLGLNGKYKLSSRWKVKLGYQFEVIHYAIGISGLTGESSSGDAGQINWIDVSDHQFRLGFIFSF